MLAALTDALRGQRLLAARAPDRDRHVRLLQPPPARGRVRRRAVRPTRDLRPVGDLGSDPARRQNGPGDAVTALPPRVLLRAAYDALEWPRPRTYAFPEDSIEICRLPRQVLVPRAGVAVQRERHLLRGVRDGCVHPPGPGEATSDECARSSAASACSSSAASAASAASTSRPGWSSRTHSARAAARSIGPTSSRPGRGAGATDDATVGDVVAALKDRLVGDPRIDGAGGERAASSRSSAPI